MVSGLGRALTALCLGCGNAVAMVVERMNFENDFLSALRAAEGYHALMELVRRHRLQGLSVDAAYKALEEIWLEHGFNATAAEEGTLQDTLETVMEKVWFGQPVLELWKSQGA